jgi:hypothetical protein|tara:strand:- start:2268 stop:2624 length:357 start_codon:yes stop_codon:yes gene_type:complete
MNNKQKKWGGFTLIGILVLVSFSYSFFKLIDFQTNASIYFVGDYKEELMKGAKIYMSGLFVNIAAFVSFFSVIIFIFWYKKIYVLNKVILWSLLLFVILIILEIYLVFEFFIPRLTSV